ncbi:MULTISPECIES: heme-binding protein [unclassified Mycolicibacterium]|uniref:heme-binding protein n=1 Tax=unclassified Mycolicibacterium TaxID=2636767 RepID=UPI0012DF94F7|nr:MULTISPECIES: heme-binding protein [unclassified Mycolicibacterium]MUL82580.1 hemophore-related protein [Mycolicibacterium sp. CBMA 329]MUL88915.1 hemophore-related protein [Mycolicibacterium sp. CBMA 331]MUL97483.1 hemophore-related protein [Mycolicibacterium sp. CBMA 334]MUM26792.1 hemophore-related protein [Mycolicibacterium sp. CBMA 295]MUM38431.1 hemophore-related protein [Mycolicibacterium sp. CBMA 247]
MFTRVIAAGAISLSLLAVGVPIAAADEPNCTSADLAGVMAGVTAATSAYLFAHPDVNDFFTSLKGQPKDQMRDQVRAYLEDKPQTRAELEGLRQPAVDFHNRCG